MAKVSSTHDTLLIIEKITHLLNKDAFKEVEAILLDKTENVSKLPIEVTITYLRCTFYNKAYFSDAWELLKEAAIKEITSQGLDANHTLTGLL